MKGTIYIVTNDINSKVYIGKTYTTIQTRWKRHISDAFRNDRLQKGKFHRAIAMYGPEHFTIKPLAQFEQGILEKKEIEYIAKYDSYYNGYNSTLGGDGHSTIEYDEDTIVKMYKDGLSVNKIAEALKLGTNRPIVAILANNGIVAADRSSKPIVIHQTDGIKIINTFSSKNEAYRWLLENNNPFLKRAHAYNYIKQSCDTGCKRFGYYWKYEKDR